MGENRSREPKVELDVRIGQVTRLGLLLLTYGCHHLLDHLCEPIAISGIHSLAEEKNANLRRVRFVWLLGWIRLEHQGRLFVQRERANPTMR